MKRILTVFPIAVMIMVVYFMFSVPKDQPVLVTPAFEAPSELASLPQSGLVTGAEAMNQISRMHGSLIDVNEAYIAQYVSDDGQIILWASESPTSDEGEQLFRVMDEKMPASEVFTDREEVEIAGQKMVKVLGQGMEHYYWAEGKYNYWVGIANLDAVSVVEDLLKKI